ncbi:hypothetical protein NIT7321_00590 [Phaeobacter italicus]|uniref:Uncharacterized protein n=1 Tax=Phaeobacter italicus TaxID=481446 RepID=A0A0H5CXY5_9RHOB|nr:hypothetical protein [Phaeobacter italicus]CRL09756.1 hypothetical protein NIT7321_00590 [Phaeobacter italicus]
MKLYSLNGGYPVPLPDRILVDGVIRTDPTSFTAEEIEAVGLVVAPDQPEFDPQSEQLIWDGSAWSVEPMPVRDPVVVYASLNKLEAMALFRQVTGTDDAGELAMRKDPALELLWMKWETDVPQSIHRDNPVVGQFLSGLIAAGHATDEQKAAMLAAWPTV